MWREFSLAWRRLTRQPAIMISIVLVLTFIIGVESLLIVVTQQTLLKPLPYPRPDELVLLTEENPLQGLSALPAAVENFNIWQEQGESFAGLAAWRMTQSLVEQGEQTTQCRRALVTPNFFKVLGAHLYLGSGFSMMMNPEGNSTEAILSYPFWTTAFFADPSVVGGTFRLDGSLVTIVGVAASTTHFPRGAELWTAQEFSSRTEVKGTRSLSVLGRLRIGATPETARAELRHLSDVARRRFPDLNQGFSATASGLKEELTRDYKGTLLILVAVSTLALVVGCLNLSSLQLARLVRQRRELGTRFALGSNTLGVLGSPLAEILLLTLAGATGGVLLSLSLAGSIGRWIPELNNVANSALMWPLFAVAGVLVVICGAALVVVPITYLRSIDPLDLIRESAGAGAGRLRFSLTQSLLLVAQIGLALPVVVGLVILTTAFLRLQSLDVGLETKGLLVASVAFPDWRSQEALDLPTLSPADLESLAALPGVLSVAAVSSLPTHRADTKTTFVIHEHPFPTALGVPIVDQRVATPNFFATTGIQLVEGREFTAADSRQAPKVVVVNEAFAERFFPTESPVGQRIRIGSPQEVALYGQPVLWTVVGVVKDVLNLGLGTRAEPSIYLPLAQMPVPALNLVVRHQQTLRPSIETLVDTFSQVQAAAKLSRIRSYGEIVASLVGRPGLQTLLFAGYSLISLLLLAISTYALVSCSVDQNTRALGISIALGARKLHLARVIWGRLVSLATLGLVVGGLSGLVVTRWIQAWYWAAEAPGWIVLGISAVAMTLFFGLSAWIPTRSITKLEIRTLLGSPQ